MVEVTSKPTDISKIQDIMNAISSNNSSDKTGLMVDYAAGSKLESGINELKKLGKEQVDYLKKMVGYQEAMLGKARSESVSSVASASSNSKKGGYADEGSGSDSLGSVLAAAGSGGLMALLGPLGLQAAAAMLFKTRGTKPTTVAEIKPTTVAEIKPQKPSPKLLTVDERLAAIAEDKRLAALADKAQKPKLSTKILTTDEAIDAARLSGKPLTLKPIPPNSPLSLKPNLEPKLKLPTKILTTDEAIAAFRADGKPVTLKPIPPNSPLSLKPGTATMAPAAEVKAAQYAEFQALKQSSKFLGPLMKIVGPIAKKLAAPELGPVIGAASGYFDKELKDRKITARGRMTQGVLETIPELGDLVSETLVTKPINALGDLVNLGLGKLGVESKVPKLDMSVTPMFREFMLDNVIRTEEQSAKDLEFLQKSNRFKPYKKPPTVQVPDKPLVQPQSAPIIIAPPAAPANSMTNSNNQQTTIINQTKDVSASLYTQMIGGNR